MPLHGGNSDKNIFRDTKEPWSHVPDLNMFKYNYKTNIQSNKTVRASWSCAIGQYLAKYLICSIRVSSILELCYENH